MNTKSIEWAYPGSDNAKRLGFERTGCWHVTLHKDDGDEIIGDQGFSEPDNPGLISIYRALHATKESPHFARYGNARALAATRLDAAGFNL